jgi:transcriptional regulator with XRE-family HTH domain
MTTQKERFGTAESFGRPVKKFEPEEPITIPTLARRAPDLIRQRRTALGWSQTMLAKAAGMNAPWISRIETGLANPTEKTLARVLAVFGYEIDDGAIYWGAGGPDFTPKKPEMGVMLEGPGRPVREFLPDEPITAPVPPDRIPDLIRQQRTARLWSQKRLAKKAGVSTSWLSRIEKRHDRPATSMLNRVLPVLGYELVDGAAYPKAN